MKYTHDSELKPRNERLMACHCKSFAKSGCHHIPGAVPLYEYPSNLYSRYMAEILLTRRKTLSNQSINLVTEITD